MRNLKRTLSLALTAIMLLGMMIINVSAADSVYDDFTDIDEIVNKDAVNLLVTLGIVNGKEDGSYFDPTGDVTRAEMAKMIAVALNKGVDDTDLYIGMNTGLTDVKGHWAEGSINFCVNRGIIAGRGDGRFDPAANVTAAEAAKMLLVAVGYDPNIEGFVGNNWAANVTAKASSLSLFDGYNGNMLATLNRDDAALLIYNALDIAMVQSYINNYAVTTGIGNNSDPKTILSSVYGVLKIKGVVTANKWASLEDETDDTWSDRVDNHLIDNRTKLQNIQVYNSNTVATNTSSSLIDGLGRTEIGNGSYSYYRTFNVDTPVEYLGQTVTMYIRKTTILTDYEVIGVYLREIDNDVATKDSAKSVAKDAVDKTGLTVDKNTLQYVNYGLCGSSDEVAAKLAYTGKEGRGIDVTIIDNNKDGVADYILYLRRDLDVVSMSKNDVVLRQYNGNKSISSSDIVTDLNLAADDVVLVVTYGERFYIDEPDVITGVMTAYNNSKTDEETIDVDGTTYNPSAIGFLGDPHTSAHGQNDILDLEVNLCGTDAGVQFKTTYEFFLDTHGNIRAFRPTEESLPNYALILESGYNPGVYSSDASGKVTAVLSDGTKDTFALNFSASANNIANQLGYTGSTKTEMGVTELKAFLGTDYTDNSTTRPWANTNNDMIFAHLATAQDGTDLTETPKFDTDVERARHYTAGQAAGYIISYTLNNDGVMTIKNIIGGVREFDSTGAVVKTPIANGKNTANVRNWNNYLLTNLKDDAAKTLHTNGGTLFSNYNSGTSTVWFSGSNNVAVDRNTVAFYYESPTKYDVRVGYDKMNDIATNANGTNLVDVVASTLVRVSYTTGNTTTVNYTDSNLAEAILFGNCPATIARDYAYVLNANTVWSDDYATLNVIFEDGTAGTLKVKQSDYDTYFDNNSAYGRLWAYTIGSDGYAKVTDDRGIDGDGYRLKVGTIEMLCGNRAGEYFAYNVNTIKIWDIDTMKAGQDATKVADITNNYSKYWKILMVLDTDGKTIRTAFVSETPYHSSHVAAPVTNHATHSWAWKDVTYLNNNYKFANNCAQVVEALNSGVDVRVSGNLSLTEALVIPAGQTLRIEGNLDAQNYSITGNGNLYVGGHLTNTRNTLDVANVIVTGTWTLATNTTLNSSLVYAQNINLSGYSLTVASNADLHVGYNYAGNDSVDDVTNNTIGSSYGNISGGGVNSDVTVNGHLEVEYDLTTGGKVIVNSPTTLVVGRNLQADTLSVTVAATDSKDVVTVGGTTQVDTLTLAKNSVTTFTGAVTVADEVKVAGASITLGGNFTANVSDVADADYTGTTVTVAPTSASVSIDLGTTAAKAPTIVISNENLADGVEKVTSVSVTVVNKDGDDQTVDVADSFGDGTDLNGVVVEIKEDADGNVSSEPTEESKPEEVAYTLKVETTGDYVTANDTAPVVITFGEKATNDTATVTIASAGGEIKVGESTYSSALVFVADSTAEKYEETVTISQEGKQNVTFTITVNGGKLQGSGSTTTPDPDEGT